MRSQRSAFTLVELLVVIAVIGLLLALLLPAVQAAREAARQAECKNHMRQVGLAIQMHHDTKRRLPNGWTVLNRPNPELPYGDPGWGWAARLLPYLEQTSLHDMDMNLQEPITAEVNERVRGLPLEVYRCPSDNTRDWFHLEAGTDHEHEEHEEGEEEEGEEEEHDHAEGFPYHLATANVLGTFGTIDVHEACESGNCSGNGVFFLNSQVRFRDISDGLSQTFFVGERASRAAPATWLGVIQGGDDAESRVVGSTYAPLNSKEEEFHGFSSAHPAGAHFLFGDGSVRLLSHTIRLQVYRAFATRGGGEHASE